MKDRTKFKPKIESREQIISFKKNKNKLRYRYYISNNFFYFLTLLIGSIIGILVFVFGIFRISTSTDDTNTQVPFYSLILSAFLGYFICYAILKIFFGLKKNFYKIPPIAGSISAFIVPLGLYLIATNLNKNLYYNSSVLFFGFIILCLVVLSGIFLFKKTKTIRIYPDRIYIGKRVIYYKDIIYVYWVTGSIEEAIELFKNPEHMENKLDKKELKILTPLLYESEGRDFSVIHYLDSPRASL